MSKKVAVIDGNSLMHRAYHGFGPLSGPDGTPTNAVYGFLTMFLKFVDLSHPDAIICAFDAGHPEFRLEALAQYKAQRKPMDEELRVQFPVIEEMLEALNIPVVKVDGWEGDDILGTVSLRCEERGYQTLLVSGDKDIYQLVTEKTHVVTTKKGMSDIEIYGPCEVEEKYGIKPCQFIDFLGLQGDTADNIPGIPGVGPKTATALLQQFGTLEGVYANLDKLKGKQLENIRDNEGLAYASRLVATIRRDVDVQLDVDAVTFPSFDTGKALSALRKYNIFSLVNQVTRIAQWGQGSCASRVSAGSSGVISEDCIRDGASIPDFSVLPRVCTGSSAMLKLEKSLLDKERIFVASAEPRQVSLFDQSYFLAIKGGEYCAVFEGEEADAVLARLVRDGVFVTHEVKTLVQKVFSPDSSVPALVDEEDILTMKAFDLSLAAYVLNSSLGKYDFDRLLGEYLETALPDFAKDADVAVAKAVATEKLFELLSQELADEQEKCYSDIDLPLVGVLLLMERCGVKIDGAYLSNLGKTTAEKIARLQRDIYDRAGEEFNIDSPKQLAHILYDKIGLIPFRKKKTQNGYSTDASVLKDLSGIHPLPGLILSYRELAKIKSTYIDALPPLALGDGYVHGKFNETVTTTGRLSSSEPNLQNIPVRTDFGREIRRAFVPRKPGEVFVSSDYSQIELRLLAHLSGDAGLIQAFNSGADFHASTASRVFGLPLEAVTPALRSKAKAVNFGIVYGQQAFGLAESLGITRAEAKEMIDRYFDTFPEVRAYLDRVVEIARAVGYAETMFGRRRYIPELRSSNANIRGFGERTAMNHPMQGSAADIIKLAMRQVVERVRAEGLQASLMVQVHDELDFSAPAEQAERVAELVKETMEGVVALRVPLIAEVSIGENWAEAH